ncbi:MAG: 5-(carboxyamino)imidazole ribonucleotide synthase [Leptospiraceae bacterium]|nr:5-(carboxyamino)imidazole ribonucleotide synthase [Leptospiraceae bacterium]
MESIVTSHIRLGIIAGGQLAKMLIQEASKWDIQTYVLDADPACPAGRLATRHVRGSHLDYDAVYQFGQQVELITFEIENVNIAALRRLQSEGKKIIPDPAVLELIRDKGLQKQFYADHQLPSAPFRLFEHADQIRAAVATGELALPFVQKVRQGGYDGRGVAVMQTERDLDQLLPGPSLTEDLVSIARELAVIVARNDSGQTIAYDPVEMTFNAEQNLVENLIYPALIDPELANQARQIALTIIQKLDMRGVLAVELFVDERQQIIINEIAPRPHNSGHHTMESVITSQFEQHLRAILNLPLGSTRLKLPAVMVNLLGAPGYSGPVKYSGLTDSMAIEGVKIHIYGKAETRPWRKMGHATILADNIEDAIVKANRVSNLIQIKT